MSTPLKLGVFVLGSSYGFRVSYGPPHLPCGLYYTWCAWYLHLALILDQILPDSLSGSLSIYCTGTSSGAVTSSLAIFCATMQMSCRERVLQRPSRKTRPDSR